MTDFVYPSNVALQKVEQILMPRMMNGRVIFEIMPIRNVDSHLLEWEQQDDYVGLQQVRGLNGDPTRVQPLGGQRFLMEPGVYGEFMLLDERQLTLRRPWGTFTGNVDVSELVLEKQQQLLQRRLDRIEQIGWSLLVTGTFSVADQGSVLHTDSYTFQAYNASTWGTVATATPLADFRAVQLLARGYSMTFGPTAKAYMNQTTWNNLLSNTNAADLGGRKAAYGESINGRDGVMRVFGMEGLPELVVYDQGYKDDSGTFQLYIPNGKVIVVGQRLSGTPIAEYRMTRNANNPNMESGPYMKTVDDPARVPRSIEVHDGHNGGPVMFFPSAIVVMDVS